MITIKLPTGEEATVDDGVWRVPDNEEIQRVLNDPAMQPPENGHYAPSADARMAQHVLKGWGGEVVRSDEVFEPGKLYLMPKADTPTDADKFVWDSFTPTAKPAKTPEQETTARLTRVKRPTPVERVLSARSYRERLQALIDLGGPGSGNFGHGGRPGEVGGSSSEGGKSAENAAKEAEYHKLQANRAAVEGGKKYVDLEHGERMAVQDKQQARLKELLPKGATAIIADPNPKLLRTADTAIAVLEEMKAAGMAMPNSILIDTVSGKRLEGNPGIRAAVHGVHIKEGRQESLKKHLVIEIPETLPVDAPLDHAVAAVFSGKVSSKDTKATGLASGAITPVMEKYVQEHGDPEYPEYDRFSALTLRDVIVHEMGHVQAGHRGALDTGTLLGTHAGLSREKAPFPHQGAIQRAMLRVSVYASTSQDEFLAEAFTRMYRGETLSVESGKLYHALNGPAVPVVP